MKYRRLTLEELGGMEKEFINFLATRGVPGEDWVKIKEAQPERMNELLDEFSNLVFEKILRDVSFLELKTARDIKIFKCGEQKMELMGVMISGGDAGLNFLGETPVGEKINQLQKAGAELQVYQAEKGYKDNREKELFTMMEAGCVIVEGELFELLTQITSK